MFTMARALTAIIVTVSLLKKILVLPTTVDAVTFAFQHRMAADGVDAHLDTSFQMHRQTFCSVSVA
jgi:hypothetical protein